MTNNSIKATSAKINLGFAVIDGLMLPSGEYAIAVPQIANLFQYQPSHASQSLKRLLGEDFSPHKVKTAKMLPWDIHDQAFQRKMFNAQ